MATDETQIQNPNSRDALKDTFIELFPKKNSVGDKEFYQIPVQNFDLNNLKSQDDSRTMRGSLDKGSTLQISPSNSISRVKQSTRGASHEGSVK